MNQAKTRPLHQCDCETCHHYPRSETAKEHRAINRLLATLDEKSRRRFAGQLVINDEYGDVQRLIEIIGLSRNTICRGRDEIKRIEPRNTRVRVRRVSG
jgi:hypothetical protein